MWIKWKYNDHGWPDFKELEIPDDLDGEECVEDYLCERRDLGIPTWGERFMSGRIHWEKLDLSEEELLKRKLVKAQATYFYHKTELKKARKALKDLGGIIV